LTSAALTARWVAAMLAYVGFLVQQQQRQDAEMAATLTLLELPNLFALLDLVQAGAGEDNAEATPERTIDLATDLYGLLQNVGKPRLLQRVGAVRDAAAAKLGDTWGHAAFQAARTRIEQQLGGGQFREALTGAQQLLQRARAGLEENREAYPVADYDLAIACILLARVLRTAGDAESALPLLAEARQGFEAIVEQRASKAAEGMASGCLTEQGDCLLDLGRLDEAAAAYEEAIRRDEERGAERGVAAGKLQLGTVRLEQRRYKEALAAYQEARQRFTQLGEPGSVATVWHQSGMVYQEMGEPEAAEDAYRKSLAIKVQQGDVAGQATTLLQLGNLYKNVLDRPENAVRFYRQAADKTMGIGDMAKEGAVRNNLAATLRKLREFEEARREIRRAIDCKAQFGYAAEPWKTWGILAKIENDAGNPAAGAKANTKARDLYLAYRRDGGENHSGAGRIALAVTQALKSGDPASAAALLQQLVDRPDANASFHVYFRALQAIVSGSRDRSLADAPELDYTMAAEILFLIESLENARG